MARFSRCAVYGAVLLFVLPLFVSAGPDDDPRYQEKLQSVLAVQAALREGREQLQRGQYKSAVHALEREVHRASGDKEFLAALESAYRGYIRELQQAHNDVEWPKYVERLAIIDPGSRLDRKPVMLAALASGQQQPVQAAPVKQPEVSVRGAFDHKANVETDPFSDANQVRLDPQALLVKADQEFKEQHYLAAGRLYQQVSKLDPKAVETSKDCWAYCKLHGVVETLNQPKLPPEATPELEREVRQAMSLSPKLDDYGRKLLQSLKERGTLGKSVAVVESVEDFKVEMRDAGVSGPWHVLETANFRILHNQTPELAARVAKSAELTRLAMTRKWFGDKVETWNPPCDLYLHATAQDYSHATGVPTASPGHSTIRAEGERVLSRRIDVHCDDPNMPIGVLPHETTHVVLAGHYGNSAVPRWADEGMAVLTEPRDRVERHLRNIPRHRDEHALFNVGKLMELNDYPQREAIGPFYAQSVSLVEYLSSLKGPQTFTAFLRDGLRGGYEPALQKHFGIQGYADLERRWQTYAFNPQTAAVSEKPR